MAWAHRGRLVCMSQRVEPFQIRVSDAVLNVRFSRFMAGFIAIAEYLKGGFAVPNSKESHRRIELFPEFTAD